MLYDHYSGTLAGVVTDIFNSTLNTNEWPAQWSKEYVTIIPKGPSPESIDACRNISCTNYLPKVLENFVLEWIREDVKTSLNQYGGEPGCGPAHFLIDTLDYVTSSLEDNRAAVILTSVDYSKAFNRLQHSICLRELAKKGASEQMLNVIAGFLGNRTMTVRLGQAQSEPRRVHTGAPQGSVLGCFLFNVGIDTIEDGYTRGNTDRREIEYINHIEDYPAFSTPTRVGTGRRLPNLSPIREDGPQVKVLPRAVNAPEWIRKPRDPRWTDKEIKNLKYVDDGANLSKDC